MHPNEPQVDIEKAQSTKNTLLTMVIGQVAWRRRYGTRRNTHLKWEIQVGLEIGPTMLQGDFSIEFGIISFQKPAW